MRRVFIAIALPAALLLGLITWYLGWQAGPQTLPGRLVEYHKIYDRFWDVACDKALDGSDMGCYVQYVDVYRPRPDFAAAMVEFVMHEDASGVPDPHIRFDLEPGLSFLDTTITIETPDGPVPIDVSHCAVNTCPISGDRARAIVEELKQGTALRLEIGEGREAPAQLSWPLQNFEALFADFAAQRAARGLP